MLLQFYGKKAACVLVAIRSKTTNDASGKPRFYGPLCWPVLQCCKLLEIVTILYGIIEQNHHDLRTIAYAYIVGAV